MANNPQNATLNANAAFFRDFLAERTYRGTGNDYNTKIEEMVTANSNRLIINVNDIIEFSERRVLTENHFFKLLKNPADYIPAFEQVLKTEVADGKTQGRFAPDIEVQDEYFVGFDGSFGAHRVSPRGLNTTMLRSLVNVEGIITKMSLVRPKLTLSVHYSDGKIGAKQERYVIRSHRDATSATGLPTAPIIPTRDEDGNMLIPEWGLSKFKDVQTITVQEMPERAPPGQLPRSVEVVVENDLVDAVKPGDRVSVVGVFRALPTTGAGAQSRGIFKTALLANNVQLLSKEIQGPTITPEDIENIKQVSQRPDAFQILTQSLAPSIYGHNFIKKAILLQMLGGNEKNITSSGIHLRGDINILMVGDPGTAKSQLLRFVLNVAPLAVSTSGRGSTGVGLTAAVVQDTETGDRRLEAGAMVLADRGVVCIDEFDKMSEEDRVAIHEVMEQQTVTISKAGIHASLNARCSVLAAANPIYGKYDASQSATRNISMPDSLLSRFDLLFIVLDRMDPLHDRNIADHVLRMHRYHDRDDSVQQLVAALEEDEPTAATQKTPIYQPYDHLLHGDDRTKLICTIPFLKKYIIYAKRMCKPVLSEEARKLIIDAFDDLRKRQDNSRTLPVTARQLETMIRLATAHAKVRLSKDASEEDAIKALEIMRFALYNENQDADEDVAVERGTPGNNIDGDDGSDDGPRRSQLPAKRKADQISVVDQDAMDVDPPSAPANKRKPKDPAARSRLVSREVVSMLSAASGEAVKSTDVLMALNAQLRKSGSSEMDQEELDTILEQLSDSNKILYDSGEIYQV